MTGTATVVDLRLREGQVHTADGGLEFVLEVLERAERHLCGKAAVRFDAGYPGAHPRTRDPARPLRIDRPPRPATPGPRGPHGG